MLTLRFCAVNRFSNVIVSSSAALARALLSRIVLFTGRNRPCCCCHCTTQVAAGGPYWFLKNVIERRPVSTTPVLFFGLMCFTAARSRTPLWHCVVPDSP